MNELEHDHQDLAEHWALVQKQMAGSLEAARHQNHAGSSGDASEYDWAEWFRHYLPSRYAVLKDACVIDCLGNLSQQIDVVIYDTHFTPRVWVHGEKAWVPSEAVYAVVECKAGLDKETVEAAAKKVASVRSMERRSKTHTDNTCAVEKKAEPKHILGILVADRSDWALPVGRPLTKALGALPEAGRLDLICAVGGAGVSIDWNDDGTPEALQVGGDLALIGFFSELVSALQVIGSVAPIDFDAYTDMLEWNEV